MAANEHSVREQIWNYIVGSVATRGDFRAPDSEPASLRTAALRRMTLNDVLEANDHYNRLMGLHSEA